MPITSWQCPACGMQSALDHFDATACGNIIHPDYARAVLADSQRLDRSGIGISDLFGCPRKKAIYTLEDIAIDPLGHNSMLGGSTWDAAMSAASGEPAECQVEVAGVLDGIPVTGHIDRRRGKVIDDWKCTNDFARKGIETAGPKPEHIVQVSLYGELLRQQTGEDGWTGKIWYRFMTGIVGLAFELWPVESCLAHRPYNAEYTVREILHLLTAPDWKALPLVGESITFGSKTGCDYCSVFSVCHTASSGAPF